MNMWRPDRGLAPNAVSAVSSAKALRQQAAATISPLLEPPETTERIGARVARLPRRGRSSSAAAPRSENRWARMAGTRAAAIAFFGGLLIISLAFKVRGLGSAYWIDEGLSVGIGNHPLTDIPGLLRQDGSPPLYYMLVHIWTGWFGTGEFQT